MAGIDEQLRMREMAIAGNPQAAQQKYAQSKDLMDLLVAQKVSNDYTSARNAMQAATQTSANPIIDQLDMSNAQVTKNDMMRSLMPGVAIKAGRDQQAMQRQAMGIPSQPAPNIRMADGGIVGYQQGGGVKRFQEGLAVIGDDESRFDVTDSGLSPEEAIATDMQRQETGGGAMERVGDLAGDAIDWASENKADAAALGLMFVPGIGWTAAAAGRGIALTAKVAAPILKKYGPIAGQKIIQGLKTLGTKATTRPNPAVIKGPGFTMRPPGASTRLFDPLRTSFVGGAGLAAGLKANDLFNGEDEAQAQTSGTPLGNRVPSKDARREQVADPFDVKGMVDRLVEPEFRMQGVLDAPQSKGPAKKKGMFDNVDIGRLQAFLAGGGGQTSTASALGGGLRGLMGEDQRREAIASKEAIEAAKISSQRYGVEQDFNAAMAKIGAEDRKMLFNAQADILKERLGGDIAAARDALKDMESSAVYQNEFMRLSAEYEDQPEVLRARLAALTDELATTRQDIFRGVVSGEGAGAFEVELPSGD
jgi:hypothetical protein